MSVQLNRHILNSRSTGELCELIEEHAEEFDHNGCHPVEATASGAAGPRPRQRALLGLGRVQGLRR
jgi:hypothetical protein